MSKTVETTTHEDPSPPVEEHAVTRRLIHIQVIVDGLALTASNTSERASAEGDDVQGRPPVFMVSDAPGSQGNGTGALRIHAVRGTRIIWSLTCLQPSPLYVSFAQLQIVRDPDHVFRWLDPILLNGFYRAKVRHEGTVNLFSRIALYNILGERQLTYSWRSTIQVQSGLSPVTAG